MNQKPYRPYSGRRRNRLICLLLALVATAVVVLGSLGGYIAFHGKTEIIGSPRVMVIFGCQVKEDGPSQTLEDRLEAALDYLSSAKETPWIVVSGGQGKDEPLSEAQAMYDYLTAHGIDGDFILLEDESHNTWQNIVCTQTLLKEKGLDQGPFLLVSSDFHLARIRLLWKRCWGEATAVSTLASDVTDRPTAFAMFFREPLALFKSTLLDR